MKTLLAILLFATGIQANELTSNKTLGWPYYQNSEFTSGVGDPATTLEKICTKGYSKTIRQYLSPAQKSELFSHYPDYKKYGPFELDHLISLEIGGANDIHNFWPQPYQAYLLVDGKVRRMGAREKDVVENSLRKRICNGEISLPEAQNIISTDWIGEYLKIKRILFSKIQILIQ